jgi:hypothetical protein
MDAVMIWWSLNQQRVVASLGTGRHALAENIDVEYGRRLTAHDCGHLFDCHPNAQAHSALGKRRRFMPGLVSDNSDRERRK